MVEQADDAVDEFEGTVQHDGATFERVQSLLPRKARRMNHFEAREWGLKYPDTKSE